MKQGDGVTQERVRLLSDWKKKNFLFLMYNSSM